LKTIKAIIKNTSGKTKRSILSGVGIFVVIAAIVGAVLGVVNFIGIAISVAVLAALTAAVYFSLKKVDDLPDAF